MSDRRTRLTIERLEERTPLAVAAFELNLYEDVGGKPGGLIANEVRGGETFFVEITAEDLTPDNLIPSQRGLLGVSLDVAWDTTVFKNIDDPFDPSRVITENLPLFQSGSLYPEQGIVFDLGGTSSIAFKAGKPIGANGPERFALLRFEAVAAAEQSTITLDVGLHNISHTTPLWTTSADFEFEQQTISVIDSSFSESVTSSGPTVIVDASENDDDIELLLDKSSHELIVNGLSQQYDSTVYNEFVLDGGGGNDSIVVTASDDDVEAELRPLELDLTGPNYAVHVSGTEKIDVQAGSGGNDVVHFFDSAENDRFRAEPGAGRMMGDGFKNTADGFETVVAHATAGGNNDRASLFDSAGDDHFEGQPTESVLSGDGFFLQVEEFDRVDAYANSGGENDHADLYDSPGNDRFVSRPSTSRLAGRGYSNQVTGFDRVVAHAASGGGKDRARFYDSPGDDRFEATPTSSSLSGDGFHNQADGFEMVFAIANAGGAGDQAILFDSAGDDRFKGTDVFSVLQGTDFYYKAIGFDRVEAKATGGGYNVATILDGRGADLFFGRAESFSQQGLNHHLLGTGFDDVTAIAKKTGPNKLDIDAVDYLFRQLGSWDEE